MEDCAFVISDADRINIKYSVIKVNSLEESFEWLVQALKNEGVKTQKVLVFCQTKPQCTNLYEVFKAALGDQMYAGDGEIKDDRTRIIGMYHHNTRKEQKDTAEKAFTEPDSNMRVLFCSSSFGMGIDVKNCYLVVHVGPPKLLDEYLQQSGRVGRDELPSCAILLLFKQCTAGGGFEEEVRAYIKNATLCRRIILLDAIENPTSTSLAIQHRCCDICALSCKCLCSCSQDTLECNCSPACVGDSALTHAEIEFVKNAEPPKSLVDQQKAFTNITSADREQFEYSLKDIQRTLVDQGAAKDMLLHRDIVTGFSGQLIKALVDNMEYISSVHILMEYFPFFNEAHAALVLDTISALFPHHRVSIVTDELNEEEDECLFDIHSDSSSEEDSHWMWEEQWDDYTKPNVVIEDSDDSD